MHILRAADRTAVQWRNGGGVTREVAAWPKGAGFDDFLWRVSMAEVAADGPFSVFPGVDRVLAVLEGRLRLELDGATVELGPGEVAGFPGETATRGIVLEGPVLDLNLMTRRGRVGTLERLATGALPPGPGLALVTDPARLSTGESLARYDAVLLEAGEAISIEPGGLWLARFG